MKALVGAFNLEKALVGAFSMIVQLHRLIDLRHYKIQYKFTKPELGAGGGGGCPAQLLPARGYLRLKASLFKILAATLEHFLPAPDPRLQSHHSSAPPRHLSMLS